MDLNSYVLWLIIIAFYAPLHFMLPVLFLFATGREADSVRKSLIRRAVIDSAVSMLFAFATAIVLVNIGYLSTAIYVLFFSMPLPFIRIITHRKLMQASPESE